MLGDFMIEVDVKEDSKISRYLNLAQFLDIVQFNRLYFRQAINMMTF
jgi:hypothetical protein